MRVILKKVLPKPLVRFIRRFKNGNFNYFLWMFPVSSNKIVVCNYYGNGYGDNAKYIVNKLLEKSQGYDIVWLLRKELMNKCNFPKKVRIVQYGSVRALYEMATAKIWIDNSRKVFSPPKRKNQFYIQTWHSPLRLKKIERDIEDYLDVQYIDRAKIDAKNCNLMISGCDFSWEIYRNSFWYDGEILKCGTPRCDIFFNDNSMCREKVFKHFGIPSNIRLILFAPTFRNDSNIENYLLEYDKILDTANKKFGGEWRLLVRLHPNVSTLSNLIEYNDTIINATDYDDMQELLCAAEILITDYSSCMFDMTIANKICFIHAHDLEDYLTKERQVYFDLEKLPFYFSKSNQQLISNIMNFDIKLYNENLKGFTKTINLYEKGLASEEIVDRINKIISGSL